MLTASAALPLQSAARQEDAGLRMRRVSLPASPRIRRVRQTRATLGTDHDAAASAGTMNFAIKRILLMLTRRPSSTSSLYARCRVDLANFNAALYYLRDEGAIHCVSGVWSLRPNAAEAVQRVHRRVHEAR